MNIVALTTAIAATLTLALAQTSSVATAMTLTAVSGCYYAYGHHINVLKHFVNVKHGWWKQFEVAVSLNHDIMTSF